MTLKQIALVCRLPTLPAAASPVLVGAAFAHRAGKFECAPLLCCLLFALFAQLASNFSNDYFDALKGADRADRKGPRRLISLGLIAPSGMLKLTCAALILAALSGLALFFWADWKWPMLLLGALCLAGALAYTGGPALGYRGWGDVMVVFYFGLVAVAGTCFSVGLYPDCAVWTAALGVGLLTANILVVNNYRDCEADRITGKRTLVVIFGRRFALFQYALSAAFATFAVPLVLSGLGFGGAVWWVLGLALPAAWLTLRLALSLRRQSDLNLLLKRTAQLLLLYALVLSAAVWRA